MTKAGNIQKLILGTAQFGLDYGISNKHGQISQVEVQEILNEASEAGITTLDTAAAYGESETNISKVLQGNNTFKVITKYPPNLPHKSIKIAFQESLDRLRLNKVHGYLLHSFGTYQKNPKVLDELQDLKASGKVEKIGISLYHPQEAEDLIKVNSLIDIVQLPYSVFDRRFENILPVLNKAGIEIHARSIYLQGLYFIQPQLIPASLQKAAPKIAQLQVLATQHNISLGAMLMGFTLQNPDIDKIVVGVESLTTLVENIKFCKTEVDKRLLLELQEFEEQDENIILPYNWAKA